ncbi:MAG: DeoR family transcriptional regulator [Acutalibacteraceae bacterium]|nr:DeoR family transcriptional regulator [Acutalibacteraceae bacterium]
MGSAERRNEILKVLCRRRHETIVNLAFEFGVSERTIRRDIETLSLTEPIYTQAGRYGGGVYVVDGYSFNQMYASEKELDVLHKLCEMAENRKLCALSADELSIFKNMIAAYSKPTV